MITVTCSPGRVEVRGHSGCAPRGQDLVCAGVTALVWTLLENGEGEIRPGYARVEGRPEDLEPVVRGLRLLGRRYPRYLRLREG